ncbi:hypothetical protein M5D96_010785 [Drosophila gunungcola]|uniref:Uncharacterized protein n=1 Tax=Drosophila gunungcola TaxID=103775 RepID=A0A9P9YH63_9MUSC|nr:hypothetical protein M5D96_010785 [Drosophila gunungcola]
MCLIPLSCDNATPTCEWHEQLIWVCFLLHFGKSKRNYLKLMNMSKFTRLCNAQQDILNATFAICQLGRQGREADCVVMTGLFYARDPAVMHCGQGSAYIWELFYARDPAVMHCGTASRNCSVRSRFQ